MRSDVKIGIICAFVLLLGVVGYFAWSSPKPSKAQAKPEPAAAVTPETPVASGSVGTPVAPPGVLDHSAAIGDPVASTGSDVSAPTLQKQVPTGSALADKTAATGDNTFSIGTGGSSSAITTGSSSTTGTTGSTGSSATGNTGSTGSAIASSGMASGSSSSWTPAITTGSTGATGTTGATSAIGSSITGSTTNYSVVSGDTIWSIAKKFKVTRASLMAANNLNEQSKLSIKQVLKIPAPSTSSTPSTPSTPALTPTIPTTPARGAAVGAATPTSTTNKTYTVKANDDLRKIANSVYGDAAKWSKIYAANKTAIGENPNILKAGAVLKIPA